jgi:glucan endo-1,3-alpha-glucosidase
MVGNSYPYTVDNWLSDIVLAHSSGIDRFALNVGVDTWQPSQVANA